MKDRCLDQQRLWCTCGGGGKYACVDMTEVSSLVESGIGVFKVGQASLKAASSKVAEYEKMCFDNHMFPYHLCLTLLSSQHQRLLTFYIEFKGSYIVM